MEGEVPALEVQGLTGGLGFPWVGGSWPASQLPHDRFTLPGHWCLALWVTLQVEAAPVVSDADWGLEWGSQGCV